MKKGKTISKIDKLILPVAIVVASLILGGFFYATQVNKQRSIEKQLEIKMEDKKREDEARAEQTKKEYVAKRSGECYSIYEKEREAFNNVEGNFYNEADDECIVRYTTNEYAGADCDEVYGEELPFLRLNCRLGIFTKRF